MRKGGRRGERRRVWDGVRSGKREREREREEGVEKNGEGHEDGIKGYNKKIDGLGETAFWQEWEGAWEMIEWIRRDGRGMGDLWGTGDETGRGIMPIKLHYIYFSDLVPPNLSRRTSSVSVTYWTRPWNLSHKRCLVDWTLLGNCCQSLLQSTQPCAFTNTWLGECHGSIFSWNVDWLKNNKTGTLCQFFYSLVQVMSLKSGRQKIWLPEAVLSSCMVHKVLHLQSVFTDSFSLHLEVMLRLLKILVIVCLEW